MWHIQLRHRFFQLGALFAFNAARYATTARIVGHQHKVTPCEADVGGERCALVAALVFFHLHNDLHAFFEHVLNARFAAFVVLEIGAGDFFKRQKAVSIHAVIHKAGFQRGLNAGDGAGVNIAFALLFAERFNV